MNKENVHKLTNGLKFLFRGFSAISSDKSLWKWALIPVLIDLALLIFVFFSSLDLVGSIVTTGLSFIFSSTSGLLYSLLYYPLYLILYVAFVVMAIYLVYIIGSVIASPFNSFIAEKILMNRGLIKEQPFELGRWLKLSLRMLGISLVRALIFIFFGLFLFIFSFLPGVNIVTSFLAFIIIAFDNMDYSYEAAGLGLSDRFNHLKNNTFLFSGMGVVIGATLLIPGLTLLVMPLMVAGCADSYNSTK
ncbi:MAG: EI24 domain-containing protein [Bdellovibrionales bacterium]|nr:EI24 domain-containing protein [Bdellovibrionales bacterium]